MDQLPPDGALQLSVAKQPDDDATNAAEKAEAKNIGQYQRYRLEAGFHASCDFAEWTRDENPDGDQNYSQREKHRALRDVWPQLSLSLTVHLDAVR